MRTVRPAVADDIPALIALDTVAPDPTRGAQIEAWVVAGQCLLLEEQGSVLGYMALTRSFFHSPFIEMLMVDRRQRRTGVGCALVRHAITTVRPDGKLWTSTNESNVPMRSLLQRLDFVESGTVYNLDPGDPEIIFLHKPEKRGDL